MLQRLATVILVRAARSDPAFTHQPYSWVPALGLLLLLTAVVRTAWMCDDAFISLRTVDSFVNGSGLRWNPDERVQAFTHPLWLLLIAGPYAITREAYFTVLVLSVLISMAAAVLLVVNVSRPGWNAAAALLILVGSKAFVDFSTSGLENPLSYLLLALLLLCSWREPTRPAAASVAAGLLAVNRLDLALLATPVALWPAWPPGRLPFLKNAALLALPIAAWTGFSLIYYGFPFPNTAYAKLSTGIARDELLRQGMAYFQESLASDPNTLGTIAAAVAIGLRRPLARPAAAGVIAYLVYVTWIGGDFMSGRFFAAPLFVSAALIGRFAPLEGRWRGAVACAGLMVIGLSGSAPPLLSGDAYSRTELPPHGIADERGIYYRQTGLLRQGEKWQPPNIQLGEKYRFAIERGRRAVTSDFIGMQGYLAADRINIIDFLALTDPMLARLPAERPWRVGHYPRTMPGGYFDSVQFDANRVVDPDLNMYYEQLRILTREPIWSARRVRSIVLMNIGRFDDLVDRYVQRVRPTARD